MKTQQPMMIEDGEHRVLQFRPRALVPAQGSLAQGNLAQGRRLTGPHVQAMHEQAFHKQALHEQALHEDAYPEPYDLSRYERVREDEPDDFRHRILANIAAFAFTVALTAIGIWLAMSIANLRHTQDCELMGRRDCTHIFDQTK